MNLCPARRPKHFTNLCHKVSMQERGCPGKCSWGADLPKVAFCSCSRAGIEESSVLCPLFVTLSLSLISIMLNQATASASLDAEQLWGAMPTHLACLPARRGVISQSWCKRNSITAGGWSCRNWCSLTAAKVTMKHQDITYCISARHP